MEEPLLAKLAQEPGYERATVPLALFRGVDRSIPTVMRPNHFIYVRGRGASRAMQRGYAVINCSETLRNRFTSAALLKNAGANLEKHASPGHWSS